MRARVRVQAEVMISLIKSFVLCIAVTFTALFQGYHAEPTPEDVSRATTRTVVMASLMIWGLDFVMTAIMFNK